MNHWKPYEPSDSQPWNLSRVVHLHRRVAFGATLPEQQRDLASDPQIAVSKLLEGKSRLESPDGFEQLSEVIGNAAADSPNPNRLKAWWLYRCLYTPDPLQERLTLMWHNHFATSNLKVGSLHQMMAQNQSMRTHASAPFGELLNTMLRDPALLIWLDAPANRKGHPNENLARELMELFTLGAGSYSEHDVKETARALTGWTVRDGRFEQRENIHDDGEKKILGRSGRWNCTDVLEILLKQRATAKRLAWRLTSEFFGENVVSNEAQQELALMLARNNLNIAKSVETMLRSELFFAEPNINSRICDPVSFMIGPLRLLGCVKPPPSTLLLADWLRRMGQDLFYPPNVGGWNGGRTWLSTRTVIARTNYVAALTAGELHNPKRKPEFQAAMATRDGQSGVRFLATTLGIHCNDSALQKTEATTSLLPEREQLAAGIVALMTQPEAHLH